MEVNTGSYTLYDILQGQNTSCECYWGGSIQYTSASDNQAPPSQPFQAGVHCSGPEQSQA